MNSVTISVEQLVEWAASGYIFLHIAFGLVTHYRSVWQVRKYNASRDVARGEAAPRVSPFKMCVLFVGRMTAGLPWFVTRSIISPVGNRWHMTPEQVAKWG